MNNPGYKGDRLSWYPNVTLSHVSEAQHAYTDGLGNPVPLHRVAITELDLGFDFELLLGREIGAQILSWGISGIWSDVSGGGGASTYIADHEGGRLRVDFGYRTENGLGIATSFGGYIDGLGVRGGWQSHGLQAALTLQF